MDRGRPGVWAGGVRAPSSSTPLRTPLATEVRRGAEGGRGRRGAATCSTSRATAARASNPPSEALSTTSTARWRHPLTLTPSHPILILTINAINVTIRYTFLDRRGADLNPNSYSNPDNFICYNQIYFAGGGGGGASNAETTATAGLGGQGGGGKGSATNGIPGQVTRLDSHSRLLLLTHHPARTILDYSPCI